MERAPQVALVLSIVLALGAGISACGGGDSADKPSSATTTTKTEPVARVDTAKLESLLKKLLSGSSLAPTINGQPTKASKKVTSVRCPARVEQEKGATFVCRVKATDTSDVAGVVRQTGSVTLTQIDNSGTLLRYKAVLEGGPLKTTQTGKLPLK